MATAESIQAKHGSEIVLWCAYLMADWVATVALSVISNHLGDTAESIGKDGSLIDDIQLTGRVPDYPF